MHHVCFCHVVTWTLSDRLPAASNTGYVRITSNNVVLIHTAQARQCYGARAQSYRSHADWWYGFHACSHHVAAQARSEAKGFFNTPVAREMKVTTNSVKSTAVLPDHTANLNSTVHSAPAQQIPVHFGSVNQRGINGLASGGTDGLSTVSCLL